MPRKRGPYSKEDQRRGLTYQDRRGAYVNKLGNAVRTMPERMEEIKCEYIIDNCYKFGRARIISDGKLITYSTDDLVGFAKSKFRRFYDERQINEDLKAKSILDYLLALPGMKVTESEIPPEYGHLIATKRIANIDETSEAEDRSKLLDYVPRDPADIERDLVKYVLKYTGMFTKELVAEMKRHVDEAVTFGGRGAKVMYMEAILMFAPEKLKAIKGLEPLYASACSTVKESDLSNLCAYMGMVLSLFYWMYDVDINAILEKETKLQIYAQTPKLLKQFAERNSLKIETITDKIGSMTIYRGLRLPKRH